MPHRTVGLVIILALGLLGLARAAAPPPKRVPTIGVLLSASPPAGSEWKQRWEFLQELRTLGWREGENLTVEYRLASGQLARGVDLATGSLTESMTIGIVVVACWTARIAGP